MDNPAESCLLLSDRETDALTVLDLAGLDIGAAEFAYLSCCHASAVGDPSLLNESISLTSAVQLCGYPSVIGTLWQVSDRQSYEVARDVYTRMSNSGTVFDTKQSAESLHWAVCNLRDATRTVPSFKRKVHSDPYIWAPYIHIGV
jgi:CHAT domain-containing protein